MVNSYSAAVPVGLDGIYPNPHPKKFAGNLPSWVLLKALHSQESIWLEAFCSETTQEAWKGKLLQEMPSKQQELELIKSHTLQDPRSREAMHASGAAPRGAGGAICAPGHC